MEDLDVVAKRKHERLRLLCARNGPAHSSCSVDEQAVVATIRDGVLLDHLGQLLGLAGVVGRRCIRDLISDPANC